MKHPSQCKTQSIWPTTIYQQSQPLRHNLVLVNTPKMTFSLLFQLILPLSLFFSIPVLSAFHSLARPRRDNMSHGRYNCSNVIWWGMWTEGVIEVKPRQSDGRRVSVATGCCEKRALFNATELTSCDEDGSTLSLQWATRRAAHDVTHPPNAK